MDQPFPAAGSVPTARARNARSLRRAGSQTRSLAGARPRTAAPLGPGAPAPDAAAARCRRPPVRSRRTGSGPLSLLDLGCMFPPGPPLGPASPAPSAASRSTGEVSLLTSKAARSSAEAPVASSASLGALEAAPSACRAKRGSMMAHWRCIAAKVVRSWCPWKSASYACQWQQGRLLRGKREDKHLTHNQMSSDQDITFCGVIEVDSLLQRIVSSF